MHDAKAAAKARFNEAKVNKAEAVILIPVRHHKGPLSQMSAIAKEHQVRTCSASSVLRTSLPAL